jgi:hypothetical protein
MRIDQRLHIPTHDFALESCFPLLAHSSWYGAPWEATTAGCGVCSHVKLNTIHVYCSGKSQSIYMAATALDQTCSVMHHVYDDMLCYHGLLCRYSSAFTVRGRTNYSRVQAGTECV